MVSIHDTRAFEPVQRLTPRPHRAPHSIEPGVGKSQLLRTQGHERKNFKIPLKILLYKIIPINIPWCKTILNLCNGAPMSIGKGVNPIILNPTFGVKSSQGHPTLMICSYVMFNTSDSILSHV